MPSAGLRSRLSAVTRRSEALRARCDVAWARSTLRGACRIRRDRHWMPLLSAAGGVLDHLGLNFLGHQVRCSFWCQKQHLSCLLGTAGERLKLHFIPQMRKACERKELEGDREQEKATCHWLVNAPCQQGRKAEPVTVVSWKFTPKLAESGPQPHSSHVLRELLTSRDECAEFIRRQVTGGEVQMVSKCAGALMSNSDMLMKTPV